MHLCATLSFMKEIISSRKNQLVKHIQLLRDDKRYRHGNKECVVEGLRAVQTFLDAGHVPLRLLISDAMEHVPESFISLEPITCSEHVIQHITSSTSPSGVVATFAIPKEDKTISDGIILVELQDPGNMGTIIRTAAALNKKTIICVDGVDPWGPKVIQASVGTIALVDIHTMTRADFMNREFPLALVGLVVQGGNPPTAQIFKNKLLVLGSEAHGLPQEVINRCESLVTLPMPGGTESLNVAVVASIALYTDYLLHSIA
jgi:RNA methyltransferase, TrmH family